MTTAIRIDNQIVHLLSTGGVAITPIQLFKRQQRCSDDFVASLPVVSLGSRRIDSLLMQKIMNGNEIQFHELLTEKPRTLLYSGRPLP